MTDTSLHQEENLRRLARLRLIDDDFMNVFFKEDHLCAELVLRIILEIPDLVVQDVQTQVHVSNITERSVYMDVVATDSTGRTINIEIQRADKGAGRRRARFHSSMLDVSLLQKGEKFDRLPETYVVFITERDVLGRGLPVYKIERYILNLGELFDDGAHILYVNGAYRGDTPLGRLMHDFFCTRAEDMHYNVLAERMSHFKDTKKGSETVCRVMEEIREESEKRNSRRVARRLLAIGKLALDEIADCTSLPLDEVKQLEKEISK